MASYDFSRDILFEILSRAEFKTMKKCRVLSKECNDLTYESSFMRLHSARTSTMVGYLLQSSRVPTQYLVSIADSVKPTAYSPYVTYFLHHRFRVVAAANEGLVLCSLSKFGGDSFYVYKPTCNEGGEVLPPPNPRFWRTKISMLVLRSNPLRFKIVRLSDSKDDAVDLDSKYSDEEDNFNVLSNEKSWHCEIFDSKSWEWKQSDDLKLTCHYSFMNTQEVSVCGGLHWLMFNDQQDKYTILSFDGDKEEWTMTSLPDSLGRKTHQDDQIAHVSCEGKLGLINHSYETKMLDVWILNHEKIWVKKQTINLKSFNEKVLPSPFLSFSFYSADTLFMMDLGCKYSVWVYYYNFKTGELKEIYAGKFIESAYFIQTDSEPVQLKPEHHIY
ncbi:hypothetical protein ES319_D03G018600v1 [Gossypium barbadense]|uniref:F-box associated beta-propeller type 3 domain-containing protein n=1 Tax=Gossypium barbadense TaxID=3634 RepID=A0A5J5S6P6_GOSBA|nr:hypothetical protein ES319_D03G018600v1 [Gossypium barbadense]